MNALEELQKLADDNTPILAAALGIVTPNTPTQRELFNKVVKMDLPPEKQAAYAELAMAIADLKDAKQKSPVIQLQSPLQDELSYLFDELKL